MPNVSSALGMSIIACEFWSSFFLPINFHAITLPLQLLELFGFIQGESDKRHRFF